MSIEYDIMMDKKLVLTKGSGVITGIDVIRHLDALAPDDSFVDQRPRVSDGDAGSPCRKETTENGSSDYTTDGIPTRRWYCSTCNRKSPA